MKILKTLIAIIIFSPFVAYSNGTDSFEIPSDKEWMKKSWDHYLKRRVIPMYSNNPEFFKSKYVMMDSMTLDHILNFQDTVSRREINFPGVYSEPARDQSNPEISLYCNNDTVRWAYQGLRWTGSKIWTPGEKFNNYISIGMDYREIFNYPFLESYANPRTIVRNWYRDDWYIYIQPLECKDKNNSLQCGTKPAITLKINRFGKIEAIEAGTDDFVLRSTLNVEKYKNLVFYTKNKDIFKSEWDNLKLSDIIDLVECYDTIDVKFKKIEDSKTKIELTHKRKKAWFTLCDNSIELDSFKLERNYETSYSNSDSLLYNNTYNKIIELPDIPTTPDLKGIIESWDNKVNRLSLIYYVPKKDPKDESEKQKKKVVEVYFNTDGYPIGYEGYNIIERQRDIRWSSKLKEG